MRQVLASVAILLALFVAVTHAVECAGPTTCGPCTANELGCGFCSGHSNSGSWSFCRALTVADGVNASQACTNEGGTLVEPGHCPAVEPAATPAVLSTPICTSTSCGECRQNSACGFCKGDTWAQCRRLTVSDGEDALTFCNREQGTLYYGELACPTNTQPATPTQVSSVCSTKVCGACLEDARCGYCHGSYNDLAWSICRRIETDNPLNSIASVCEREGGVRVYPGHCESNAATPTGAVDGAPDEIDEVVGDINAGAVNENDLTTDVNNAPNTPTTLIIVVTVITEAKRDENGNAHFQTFVDITGDVEPTQAQLDAICDSIKEGLAKRLSVDIVKIQCRLSKKSQKRVTSTYVADMTVSETSGAATIVPILALFSAAVATLQ